MLEKRKAPWVFGEVVDIDEDDAHEFKMHRSICLEEVSTYHEARSRSKIVRTKQPASKTLCAFLNSNQGGQLFLGINDDGRVVGMKMTDDQEPDWPLCLVVIAVAPWVAPKGERSIDDLLQPIFQNEEGLCYKRRAASNTNWSVDAIRQVTEDVVATYYQEQEERLDKQIVGANSRFSWCFQM